MPVIKYLYSIIAVTVLSMTTVFFQAANAQDNSDVMNTAVPQSNPSSEIVLLVDNSNSMTQFDPALQIKTILSDFISQQNQTAYFSVVSFDEDVNVIFSLSPISSTTVSLIQESSSQLNYEGVSNEISNAMERAVYELKYNGQQDNDKHIILLTDGFNYDAGLLADSILSDITDYGIQLYAISLTRDNTLQELVTLNSDVSIKNYIISDISELAKILQQIGGSFQVVSSPPTQIQQPTAIEVPVNPNVVSEAVLIDNEDRMRSVIIIAAAIILVITMGTLIILLFMRGRSLRKDASVTISEAYLVDIKGFTSSNQYRLGEKATMLGRVAGRDKDNIDYIVIPESTIGRRHAVIEYKDYAYWIMDQGSINGTFINNIPVKNEVRLKHGDIVRLHKYEFQFSIPELDEAGMTKIASTKISGQATDTGSGQVTEIDIPAVIQSGKKIELDFDFTEEVPESYSEKIPENKSDETLLPVHEIEANTTLDESNNETLMPDFGSGGSVSEPENENPPANVEHIEQPDYYDQTLIPGLLNGDEDDATIRPNEDTSPDNNLDSTSSENDK